MTESSAQQALALLREVAHHADADGDASGASALREAAAMLAQRAAAVTTGSPQARCFGTYVLTIENTPLDLATLRPRARAVLRLLSAHAGRPVHREALVTALWPEANPDSATRSMLTAVSSVRGLLAPTPARGALQRDGHSYLLNSAQLGTDIHQADSLLRQVRLLRDRDPLAAAEAAASALDLYRGDLLCEDGPAEWVVDLREHWRQRMAAAAHDLAVLRYRAADPAGAAAAARRGLVIDRLSDPLWRVLVAALRANEDPVAAERAAAEYDKLLEALAS